MTEEYFVNFVTAIAEIVHNTNSVHKLNKFRTKKSNRRRRVCPVNLTQDEEEFYKTCVQQLKSKDEEHFFKATRMTVVNFDLLLTLLKEKMERFSNRKAIDPETRLAVTILYLAQGCNIQILAWAYELSISTVRKIVYETCDAIWDELHAIYLAPPNAYEFKDISDKFYVKTGMPNCLGAIDGKHIRIVCPKKSIVLLAACDANYVFTYVHVGALDSPRDGGVLVQSDFGRKLLSNTLNVPANANLPGTSINFPYYFVGDNAFPLKDNLMRPFPGHCLPQDKNKFNTILSKARVHIENAFGILSNRWRVLHTTINMSPKNVDKIVLATVVLHNFLMLKNDKNYFSIDLVDHTFENRDIQGQWRAEIHPLRSYQTRSARRSSSTSFQLRNILKDFIQNNVV